MFDLGFDVSKEYMRDDELITLASVSLGLPYLHAKAVAVFGEDNACILGSCHKRQKAQAPTPQAPIRNRKTRKVANAKVRNRYTNLI